VRAMDKEIDIYEFSKFIGIGCLFEREPTPRTLKS